MRALLLGVGDRARDAALVLVIAAAIADVMVWAFDAGRASVLLVELEGPAPEGKPE